MTKAEKRKARKKATAEGRDWREVDQSGPAVEWTESPRGMRARERWARAYDALDGAPEGEWDR